MDIPTVESPSTTRPIKARPPLERALAHLASLQRDTGDFEAEMVWNTMILSQYVIVHAITGREIDGAKRAQIIKHYRVTQKPDGSWPMHGEGHGYVFMTTLAYVALRLLGIAADDPLVAAARTWLRTRDVVRVPSWGKLWLAMIGLYEYEGMNPVPPELFLLPDTLPIHPNNFYCHTRYIYLGIAYLYGRRFRADLGAITTELRRELYDRPYDEIDFAAHRHDVHPGDLFVRPSGPLRAAYDALMLYEKSPLKPLRPRALELCFSRILYEQMASRRQGISPVNGLLNCLAIYANDPQHPELQPSIAAMDSWGWNDDAEGLRFCGAHSTAWDTAFVMRAILASPDAAKHRATLAGAYAWLKATQMREELPDHERERRDPIRGGWCFSDGVHRWPVSDCTAEALTAILEMHAQNLAPAPDDDARMSDARIVEAVRFILRRQNDDGGFGSYERRRGSVLLEWVNPSEMYGNCMTERSYTECTASCVGALARFLAAYPQHPLAHEVKSAMDLAVTLLKSRQLDDGSYLGFWGVNFTYGCFHVVEALVAAGVDKRDPAIARAAEWLIAKQKSDGGWGEHFSSCLTDRYVEHDQSQAAMTAWALLALMEVVGPGAKAVTRGIQFLEGLQKSDGSWPQQSQSGVFFSTAMLDYRLYKDYFSTWALARKEVLSTKE